MWYTVIQIKMEEIMRHAVSISLSDRIFKQLKSYCRKENANSSETARRALREFFYHQEFSRVRSKFQLEAKRKGVRFTEEEIFKRVS